MSLGVVMAKIKRPRKSRPVEAASASAGNRMLSTKALGEKLSCSRVTVWRAVKDGRLPQPNRMISRRVPLWSEREIDALLARAAADRAQASL
jgi:predicted DNA-binding transcriptional regulator AlpA